MTSQDHGIHSWEECVLEGSEYFQKDSGKSTHKKMLNSLEEKRRWEKLKIKISRFKEYPSSDEEYEELKS